MSDYPIPHSTQLAKNIQIRPAKPSDAKSMADSFFESFTPSSTFWSINFPHDPWHAWWIEAWSMGIEKDPTARTFIAVDMDKDPEKVVGFARWIVPQKEGAPHRMFPDLPDGVDMEIMGAFFGGMERNREELVGKEPHWFLEMLGTNTDYQGHGIGYTFCKWGCDLADKDDMKVYIDASQKGAPFYRKHFGAEKMRIVEIPDRNGPGGHGHYEYWTHLVPRRSERVKKGE